MAIGTIDPVNVAERRLAERRLSQPPVADAAVVSSTGPRRDRRAAHRFQNGHRPADASVDEAACMVCGYDAASHLALTDPEIETVTGLLNQRQAPTLMRRSILRKLRSTLRIER